VRTSPLKDKLAAAGAIFRERHGVGMQHLGARVDEQELRPEVLCRPRGGPQIAGVVRPDENGQNGHAGRSWFRIRGMSKGRTEDEQKAVETILWALAHKLQRLRDEFAMKKLTPALASARAA